MNNHSTVTQPATDTGHEPPIRAHAVQANTRAPALRGRILEDSTAIPLGGVLVQWLVLHQPATCEAPVDRLAIGAAATADDGGFEIKPVDADAVAGAALCRLHWDPDTRSVLAVKDDHGERIEHPVDSIDSEVLIRLSAGHQPESDTWRPVADYLASNRMLRVDDLARSLSAPALDSPLVDWSVTERAGALAALQDALGAADERPLLEPVAARQHDVAEHEVGRLALSLHGYRCGTPQFATSSLSALGARYRIR